jgi:FixJ family two-component response regulator
MGSSEQSGKVCIFVIDDEEVISSTIAAILRLKGFEAISFTLPLEALAASHLQVPGLLISDIGMPSLSGLDLAVQLQAFHPQCKVLLFSGECGAADFSDTTRAEKYGFEMIHKPVHPQKLLRKVQEMLSTVLCVPGSGEDRARLRTVENMKETVAALRADIAVSTARKRSITRRAERDSGE